MVVRGNHRDMQPDERTYTIKEVAHMCGVDPKTVQRWDLAGKFPKGMVFRTPGRYRRFNADKFDAWLLTRTEAAR